MEKTAGCRGGSGVRPMLRIALGNGVDECFDESTATLLRGVEEDGSLYARVKRMHVSYSMSLEGLRSTAPVLGELVEADSPRMGMRLTPRGREVLDAYAAYESDVRSYADRAFDEHFAGVL